MTTPYPLILASTSKYRQALLAQLGIEFEAMAPGVDEDQVKTKNLLPKELARELARMKAQAVFVKRPDACVIGSDQVCALGDRIFGKPGNMSGALEQLTAMQGKTHELITAVTLLSPAGEHTFVNHTKLSMRPMKWDELARYVEADRPYDCAGSYKIEGHGIRLFERIDMSDHTAIVGLPLVELTSALLKLGYTL